MSSRCWFEKLFCMTEVSHSCVAAYGSDRFVEDEVLGIVTLEAHHKTSPHNVLDSLQLAAVALSGLEQSRTLLSHETGCR